MTRANEPGYEPSDAKERRATERLYQAVAAVAATFSVDDIIQEIATSALVATEADGSFVERLQPAHDFVVVVAAAGEMAPDLGDRISYQGSVAQAVLEAAQPQVIEVLGQTSYQLPGTLADTYANGTAVVVPLIDAGEAIGVLILLRTGEDDGFSPDDVARAHTFGNLASLAFRKVHLLEATEQRSRELEQLMESRLRFMRGFSHDLKNPLGAADGHAALLEDMLLGQLNDKQLASVQRIRNGIQSAISLIDDVVEFARADTGQLQIKQQPVDVREIVRELVEVYRPAAEQAGLSIKGTLAAVPVITTDADRVRQVLGNLVSNAVKYTPSGGRIDVRTAVRHVNEDGERIAVDIVDTGIGIPEEKVPLLFREFERIDPSVRPGAGLGLAISRRIARLLGGEVTVSTRRGHGSTFTLWLRDGRKEVQK